MNAWSLIAIVATGTLVAARAAHADPQSLNPDAFNLSGALDRPVSPTRPAFELSLGGGFTQGAGGAGQAGRVEDLTGGGGAAELQLGYRMSPRFSAGAYGTLARYAHGDALGDGSTAHGATAGVQAVWHSADARAIDSWLSVGAGWRGLWLDRAGARSASLHGVEFLRVQLGIDYRITPWLAIAPVIAASLSVFLIENAVTSSDFTQIKDKRINLYGFTGVLGRFDVGG